MEKIREYCVAESLEVVSGPDGFFNLLEEGIQWEQM